ncbi:type II secretion system protein [Kamptonema formosum]|uniref:type II secretion system protein n=1 Tax=Kamptonema formosum TaxID=331992 RepID=UPI0003492D4D|nr:type II secretion system protein [Oscillatoria sp. PCC 10802]
MLEFIPLLPPNKPPHRQARATAGFTLIEMIVVIAFFGILAAVAGASFLGWLARMRLNSAQYTALEAIRQAQTTAKLRKSTWQASFREQDGKVQWAVHPDNSAPSIWNTLVEEGIKIDPANTTFYKDKNSSLWRVQFNYKGHTNGQLGRINLTTSTGSPKRCVFVSTLLGAVRTAADEKCVKK